MKHFTVLKKNTAQQCLTFPRFEASVSQSTRDDTCGENPILAMSKRRSLETNDPTAKRKIVLRVEDPSLMIGLQLEAEFDFDAPSDSCWGVSGLIRVAERHGFAELKRQSLLCFKRMLIVPQTIHPSGTCGTKYAQRYGEIFYDIVESLFLHVSSSEGGTFLWRVILTGFISGHL